MAVSSLQKRSKKQQRLISSTDSVDSVTNMSSSSVVYNATSDGGSLRRIRNPSPNDVLSGRGGNVNAHPGNSQFREWVKVRREDYSLAHSKDSKAVICREVIALVEKLGGRFLVKEDSKWWVELDDEKVMSKTSQALREGAPQIRATHMEELGKGASEGEKGKGKKRVRKQSIDKTNTRSFPQPTPPAATDLVPPKTTLSLQVSSDITNDDQNKRRRTDENSMPAPADFVRIGEQQQLGNGRLKRSNSLVLSEFGDSLADIEFVNPFADETELLGRNKTTGSSFSTTPFPTIPKPRPLWRDSSVGSNASDMGGLGALFRSNESMKSTNGSIGSISSIGAFFRENSSSTSTKDPTMGRRMSHRGSFNDLSNSKHMVDDVDDSFSVGSENTVGLPIWEWFNKDELTSSQFVPISQ